MRDLRDTISKRLGQLEKLADLTVASNAEYRDGRFGSNGVSTDLYSELRSSVLAFLGKVFSETHPYFKEVGVTGTFGNLRHTELICGVLRGVAKDIDVGWIDSLKGLVSGEVFTDFMDMASHLLDEEYKDPAAVIIGSVLEGQLRRLAETRGIPTTRKRDGKQYPLKAESLNVELAKAGAYGSPQQKLVTAWLGLRNEAAHGHYGKYQLAEVKGMHQGVLVLVAQTTS